MGPHVTARAFAVLNTSIFDAWAAYDPKAIGTRLGNTLQLPLSQNTLANKNEATSYAAYRALVDLFPSKKASFDTLMSQLGYNPANTSTNLSTPSGVGNYVAQVLLQYRHNDGANQLGNLSPSGLPYADYTGYVPVNSPDRVVDLNRWQPLWITNAQGNQVPQPFLGAQWFKVIPFALKSASQFRPQAPAAFGTPQYVKETKEVYDISKNLTAEQRVIAIHWANGPGNETTPGVWHMFAVGISQRDNHTIDDDAKMFFALSNAQLDAGISAWEAKRVYDYVRPITAIRALFDPNWNTVFLTPAFPEFVSGHSTFGFSGAEVLERFTGKQTFGRSYTDPQTGIKLYWATFKDAADEGGISRLYGGIHFRDGYITGAKMGTKIGRQAWKKAQQYICYQCQPESDD